MNPAGFNPQAMMAGQGMPQGGNVSNQLKTMLFTRFQQQQQTGGNGQWQSMLTPGERVNLVMQVTTSLNLAQPNMGHDNALKGALALEAERFARSNNKEQYISSMRQQLQVLQQKRQAQSQNMNIGNTGQMQNMANMGNMGNPQANMQGMMGQPMQATMSNQGNPMAAQFNPQLARPMQVSQLPMNGQQNPQAQMQNAAMQGNMNNQQGQPQPNGQQQANNGLSMNENQKINQLAQRMMQQSTEENRQMIMRKFQALPPHQQAQLRQRSGDPLQAHFRNLASQLWMKQMGGMRQQNQTPQNGMPQNGMQNGNNMMGQGTPMMQGRQPQPQIGQDGQLDFSAFTTQQQEALRQADSGQLVVPASNNAQMNQMMNMPMGIQAGQMNNGMNNNAQMQAMMQNQQRANGMNPQQQAAARLQAQMRQQGQNPQLNQQGQMNPQQMKMGNGQSPMPQMAQPGGMQQQRPPNATPQPRPTPTPTPQVPQNNSQLNPQLLQAMQQAAMSSNGQQQPIRRQLPPNLPPNTQQNLRNFLQTCSDEHYNVAIEHLMKSQMGNQMNNMGTPVMQNNPAMQNQAMQNGQNAQSAQAMQMMQQRLAAQNRVNQAQAMAQNQARQQPSPANMGVPPELLAQMDQKLFPRSILSANGVNSPMVPNHVVTFLQLKEWIMNNPNMAGHLSIPLLIKYQMELVRRDRQAQMNGQMNNMQQQNVNGGAPGPAPTAQMVPQPQQPNNGQMNMGQQVNVPQPQGNLNAQIAQQMQAIQVLPQELQQARQKGVFPPHMSDEEIHSKILNMKRQAMMQKFQQQHRAMAMQNAQQANANNNANNQQMAANNQQRMAQNQNNAMPQPPQRQQAPNMQPQQTPQMGNVTPGGANQQNKSQQPTPRPNQQNPNKTPQQGNKNLKRSAPEEVIDLSASDGPAPQAPAMQAGKSQQGKSNNNNAVANNSNNNSQNGQGSEPQLQALLQRFGAILMDVKAKHQPRVPQPPLNDQERAQLVQKVAELKQIIMRTEWAIRIFFQGTRDEEKTKMFLARYWHIADNVNPKEGTVLGAPTLRASEFENLILPVKQLVVGMMQSKNQNKDANAGQQGSGSQQAGQGPQQLNAANLDQHNTNLRQQAAAQGHRRSSSKIQVPQAPTAGPGQNPFSFNSPSGAGVPQYAEGAKNLTAEQLTLPRKKAKKAGQPPSGQSTPAQTGVAAQSPQIGKAQSPTIKKQPGPDVQAVKNQCADPMCEFSRKGFKTAEELAAHMRTHEPPDDPLKFAMETLATSMGLNADGTAKAEAGAKAAPAGVGKNVGVKSGTTPPAGAQSMSKIPMKGSPAMDRLKTPQHSSKPLAPTSAGVQVGANEKAKDATKPEELAMDLSFDPWKYSGLGAGELAEWLKPYDTFTGDWGNDRALRSPQLTPATTPDTNVTDKTASTRDSEVFDGDVLNMTLAMNPSMGMGMGMGDDGLENFMTGNWEPTILDGDLMSDLAAVGIEETGAMNLEEPKMDFNINDWEATFGPDAAGDKNGVPGWEGMMNEMVF